MRSIHSSDCTWFRRDTEVRIRNLATPVLYTIGHTGTVAGRRRLSYKSQARNLPKTHEQMPNLLKRKTKQTLINNSIQPINSILSFRRRAEKKLDVGGGKNRRSRPESEDACTVQDALGAYPKSMRQERAVDGRRRYEAEGCSSFDELQMESGDLTTIFACILFIKRFILYVKKIEILVSF